MPHPRFLTQANPDRTACELLAASEPLNPFATFAYLEAEKALGSEPWLFGWNGETGFLGCLAFIRSGRVNRTLNIASAPDAPEPFWESVRLFAGEKRITRIEVNTFASTVASLPPLGEELSRMERFEFVVPLDGAPDDLLNRMHMNHRRNINKGIKQKIAVRCGDDCKLDAHVQLMGASMSRRRLRGEDVACEASVETLRPYITSGFCRLFQAVLNGEIVSSIAVACAPRAFYLHSSGTSPAGMAAGASQFLMYEIMKAGQAANLSKFNLGGVSEPNSGLWQYKQRFGAEVIRLEVAEFYTGNVLHKAVSASARLLRSALGRP
jgi:hypothetical protein